MKNTVRIRIPILILFVVVIGITFVLLITNVFALNNTSVLGSATVINTQNKIFFTSQTYGANVVISDPDPENHNKRTISGYAWSQDIGWIKFTQGEEEGVFVDYNTGAVSGSAYVINTGSSIEFSSNNANVVVDTETGKFSGYAWSDDIGWIDFGVNNVYVKDSTPPNNPTETKAYTDGSRTKEIPVSQDKFFNFTSIHLYWDKPQDPGGESHEYSASGISGYYVYWGASSTAIPSSSGEFITDNFLDVDISSSGTYYLNVQAVDNQGNIYTNSDQGYTILEYNADLIPPTNVKYITTPGGNFGNIDDMFFSWPSSAGVSSEDENGILGWQYSLNGVNNWTGPVHDDWLNLDYIPYTDSTYSHYFSNEKDGGRIVVGSNIIYFRTIDKAGNVSGYISGGISYGGLAPTFEQDAQVIITPSVNTSNEFALSWSPATPFEGREITSYYYMVNSTPPATYETLISNSSLYIPVNGTSVSKRMLTGAIKGENIVYVIAVDNENGYSPSNYIQGKFTLNSTLPDPVTDLSIADTSIKDAKLWRASITWSEPVYKGDGKLTYIVQRSFNGIDWTTVGSTTGITYSDIVPSSRLYYYRVGVMDGTDQSKDNPTFSISISAMIEGRYTQPAQLVSEVEIANLGTRKATIVWVTERNSDTKISYGLTSGEYFEEEAYNSKQVTEHEITLNNLQPETTYYFKAKWTDSDGNTGESQEISFRTADSPQVYSSKVDMVGLNYAVISFEVFGATSASVIYGRSFAYTAQKEINTSPTRSKYSIVLDGLDDGVQYSYKIRLMDAEGYIYDSIENNTFTTPPKPKISNVRVQEIREVASPTVVFSWDTNTHTNSIVRYREDIQDSREIDKVDMKMVKGEHKMEISGLVPTTNYIAYVEGVDDYGNRAVSEVVRFTTQTDTRPPKIFNVKVEQDLLGRSIQTDRSRSAQLIVSWETDEPATSKVNFGEGGAGVYTSSSRMDQELRTNHLVIVSGLTPSKVYSLEIESGDDSGNISKYGPLVSITQKSSNSVLETILNSISNIFNIF